MTQHKAPRTPRRAPCPVCGYSNIITLEAFSRRYVLKCDQCGYFCFARLLASEYRKAKGTATTAPATSKH